MISATDIITYIGVPLAVLGVLPIIYNTVTTIATLQKIRRILRHGRLTAITRGDVINHVIEVELPRYTISPLDRETCKDYWRLSAFPSTILGGSWTIFNWRMNTTGIKTQRIDYSDQLRQPQAEIDFEELVSYMLDLGAVPDAAGFRMLRTSGLWVPTGTPLLLSPNQQEAALTVASLDDSDGKLSLAVSWSSDWCMRDQHSLPPYWAIIKGIPPPRPRTATGEGDIELEKNLKGTQTDDNVLPSDEEKEDTQKVIETLSDEVKPQPNLMACEIISNSPPAIKCKIGLEGLTAAIPDDNDAQMFDQPDITHLDTESGNNSKGIWFASALTALGSTSQAILWNYKIPTSILSFSRKDTIPCGILVMLEIVEESSTPEIFTQYNDSAELNEAQFRKMRERSRALQRETRLSPAERSLAVQERQLKEHEDWVQEMNDKRRRETQRAEMRMVEALQSPKWDNRLVAEHTLAWLKANGHIDQAHNLKRVVEILLWRMINDVDFAVVLGKMLDVWKAWVENGGIRKADLLLLKEAVVMFAFASLVLAVVYESVAAAHGSLAVDLQECLRIWKRVRLG